MPMTAARRLVPYYRPYRGALIGGLLLVILSAAVASSGPWLTRAAVDGLRRGASVAHTAWLAAAVVGVALVAGGLRYWMRELINGLSRRIETDLRDDLFARLTVLDAPFYARLRTGDLMARLTNDVGAVRQAAGPAVMYFANTIAGGLFALFFMLRISSRLTGLALLPMVVLPVATAWLGRLIHRRFEAVQEHFSTLTTHAQENLAGTRVVRAYRQEAAEIARFRALSEDYLARNMALARLYGIMHPLFGLLAGLGMAVVLGVGGALTLRGVITVGEFVAFTFYLAMLTWPMIALGWVVNLFQRGSASMGRLLAVLDAPVALAEPAVPRALPPPAPGGGRSVEFVDVGFHFPAPAGATPRWVLRHVSFRVPAGAMLGVVGATGSGKSALVSLMARLYDPQEGAIRVDGVDLRDVPLAELRHEIGYAPQESLLFSDTIASNLGYGLSGASDGDAAAIRWAARVAQLDATVREFPGEYDTVLGERGINLSGGQKQRAALARALARRPRLVLLDDTLSAVDTHTEAEILRGLREALAGRTSVIASHRVSAIRDASSILVLDEGRVVEQGTHLELLALGGRYWALLHRQQLEAAVEEDDAALAAPGPPSTFSR